MTEPVRVGELPPASSRTWPSGPATAMSGGPSWSPRPGYCHHPIRVAGRIEQADRATGEVAS